MKNKILKILIGISASGKSTYCKGVVEKNPDWVIVSRDDYRYAWRNSGVVDNKLEGLITKHVKQSIVDLLNNGYNVLYDATNLKASYLENITSYVKHIAKVEYHIIDVPLEVAINRDKNRERSVGEEVIKRQYEQYLTLLDSYDFSHINPTPKKYVAPEKQYTLPEAFIFDIDGTLAHTNGLRSHYDMDNVDKDVVDVEVNNVLKVIAEHGYYNILIVTGRHSCKEKTEKWLSDNHIVYDKIYMRDDNDMRKDSIIKKEIYLNQISPNYRVVGVFDDRNQVVDMWRELGLKCFQVQDGNF